ncbi:MAG: PilW family protein [Sideroxydans sp.]|nr:PilW family protein [Sideroxydans sp.]
MKNSMFVGRRSRQTGLSLVELMVSVVIALVLMIALMQLLLGTMQTDRATSDVSRMQESGRNALELMGRAIRQAGARSDANVAFTGVAVTGTDGAGTATDSVTLQYEAQEGGETDCAGAAVVAGTLMTYAFAVNTADATLRCNGITMVDNIEDLQLTYGLDADKNGVIESYVTAPTATQFGQVAAVQVALTVRGPSANIAVPASGASAPDNFLRQVFNATFTVRNQAG